MPWEISLLYFFSWNFIWFLQKEPTTVQNFRLLTAQVKFHQICTLIGYFYWKCIRFQLKKYGGNMSLDTKEWCKIWIKTYFCFKNDKNLVSFDPSTKKSKKFALWLVPSVQSIQRLTYKNTKEYISWHWRFMQNLKKSWLVVWKMTWGIWQIFIKTLESVKIGIFMGFFCPK